MSGVAPGSPVSAANTNAAFLDANGDDTGIGVYTLANALTASGPQVDNLQREHNSAASFMGKALNTVKNDIPVWINNDRGLLTDSLFARTDDLTHAFNVSRLIGHTHSGAAGQGPKISGPDLVNVPLMGFAVKGPNLPAATGATTNVSTDLSTKLPSTSTTALGIVVSGGVNDCGIKQGPTATNPGDLYKDGSGNIVYGRIVNTGGVGGTWTLSYYVMIGAVETAYSFTGSNDVDWYYQELYNPASLTPVYSPFFNIPSDNTTADVLTATASQFGKTILDVATPGAVTDTPSAGTMNAHVAAADHSHAGVHSVNGGGSPLLGDVTFAGTTGISVSQSGQTITVAGSLSGSTPADVGAAGAVGVGTSAARADHVHKGVHSVEGIFGDVTQTAGNNLTKTVASQDIKFDVVGYTITKSAQTTLPDNTSTPTPLLTANVATICGLIVDYTVLRGAGNARTGRLFIATDSSAASISETFTELGSTGVTFTADVSAGTVRVLYTTTSTGTAADIRFESKAITIA